MDFKGTKTEENIRAAFAGEAQARARYTYFSEQARKEGNDEIADLFERMAKNELTHAKIWFRYLHGGMGSSETNIQEAAAGENQEWQTMYPEFAEQARRDGFPELADLFQKVADVERDHEKTFLKAFIQLQQKKAGASAPPAAEKEPEKPAGPVYRCMFCGAVSGTRPDVCPVCEAIGAFERVSQ